MSKDLFQPYVRKQFGVDAVRVDPTNIEQVAKACGGKVVEDDHKEGQLSRLYIEVPVRKPLNKEQTKARLGDWVVRQGKTFKVYRNNSFKFTFEANENPKPAKPRSNPKNKDKVAKKGRQENQTNEKPGPTPIDLVHIHNRVIDSFRENESKAPSPAEIYAAITKANAVTQKDAR